MFRDPVTLLAGSSIFLQVDLMLDQSCEARFILEKLWIQQCSYLPLLDRLEMGHLHCTRLRDVGGE